MRRPLAGFDLDTLTVAGGFWRAAAGGRRLGDSRCDWLV